MIEVGNKKESVSIKYPSYEGADGGYYVPTVSEEGILQWSPTQPDMPAVEAVSIVGPPGERGVDGIPGESGVYIGENEPINAKVWINPAEVPDVGLTIEDVKALGYITEEEVDSKIDAIELTPGPQGPQGEKGEPGVNGANGIDGKDGYTPVKGTDYWTEEDKSEIVSDVLAAIPAAEGVEV